MLYQIKLPKLFKYLKSQSDGLEPPTVVLETTILPIKLTLFANGRTWTDSLRLDKPKCYQLHHVLQTKFTFYPVKSNY